MWPLELAPATVSRAWRNERKNPFLKDIVVQPIGDGAVEAVGRSWRKEKMCLEVWAMAVWVTRRVFMIKA